MNDRIPFATEEELDGPRHVETVNNVVVAKATAERAPSDGTAIVEAL